MYSNYFYPQQRYGQMQYGIEPRLSGLLGKQVENIEMVKVAEASYDGNVNYFPLIDGSAILTKQLQNDGTSKIMIYKPVLEQKEEIRYVTQEELESALKEHKSDELGKIKDDIEDLKDKFREFKKK